MKQFAGARSISSAQFYGKEEKEASASSFPGEGAMKAIRDGVAAGSRFIANWGKH